jgi:hypothetical protein
MIPRKETEVRLWWCHEAAALEGNIRVGVFDMEAHQPCRRLGLWTHD